MPTGHRWQKRIGCGCLTILCAMHALSIATNFFSSTRSDPIDRLPDMEKARIMEVFQLRQTIGDSIWAEWSKATIPVIVYNEAYAFLIGTDNPGPGWRTVPHNRSVGGPWELVPDDLFNGRKYYRQRLVNDHATPQAFTVRIGDLWAASMTTKEWAKILMGNDIRDSMPSWIKPIVPYRLIARIFLKFAMNTDGYICGITHESFHAYEGIVSANRLADAEIILGQVGKVYPWEDSSFNENWKTESNALADALASTEKKQTIDLANRFIALRRARRKDFHLDPAQVDLERFREWEEGLAKYTELAIWKLASSNAAYKPVQALSGDPDFDGYRNFGRKWAQEVTSIRYQSGEVRFYYTGMAQAFLLDQLDPGWKTAILQNNVFLEDLLSEALAKRRD